MAAIITDDFRKNNIENFVTDVSNSPALGGRNYYIGIGKTDPYPNQGKSLSITELSNNFVPPPPNGSILEKEDVKRNLMTLVKIGENDVRRLIPQVEYRVGATYKVFDITDPTCFDKDADGTLPCYALYTDGDGLTKLYICLNNKDDSGSIQPTQSVIPTMPNPASGSVFPFGIQQNTTTDKYIWTYIDYLNVDDQISAVVDDRVENQFIQKYLKDNEIYVYSRDECKHWTMQLEYNNHNNLKFIIGNVCDPNKLQQTLLRHNFNVIINAAAMKHIDKCEYESNECFIRYDDSPDEDWLILIYLEDSDAKKGKIVVENKANSEKHETKSFETKEIFTYSDYLVDAMTGHIDRERKKKAS